MSDWKVLLTDGLEENGQAIYVKQLRSTTGPASAPMSSCR